MFRFNRLTALAIPVALLAASSAVSGPAEGQRPALAMLGQIQPGRWELRMRGPEDGVERLCLRDGRRLIQLRHPAGNCQQLIVEDAPNQVTVQYTCRGHGYGRTEIRAESGRLIQIDSQGVADGLPFAFSAEGRLVGNCAN